MSYYMSVVLCGRNDDYGRDYLKRLQTLVANVDYFCRQYALSCQLVFVEWNPPADRPPIKSAINWGAHIGVKIITVPGRIDARLGVNRGKSGLHEFIAKNTGIRRADGQFVLSCNSDLVFSPDLFQFLGRRELSPDAVYRTTRINVRALPDGIAPADAPGACRRNTFGGDLLDDRYSFGPDSLDAFTPWNAFSAFPHDPTIREMFSFAHGLEPLRLEAPTLRQFPHLIYFNAAGDFTLLSHSGWHELSGYLENDCRNHVDSWLCYHAAKKGFAQVFLPLNMCIYHQEHAWPPLEPWMETLAKLSKLEPSPKWGLADEDLETEVIQVGAGKDPDSVPCR
jgi:hypothetical protein